jgi:hypothetical protein
MIFLIRPILKVIKKVNNDTYSFLSAKTDVLLGENTPTSLHHCSKFFFSINRELSFNQILVTIHGSCVLEPLWDVS